MNLSGIIAISGKPGLYKVIAQGKNNVIVESLQDKKRFPAYSSDRISALDDISLYTYEVEKPLKEIFRSIYDKENGQETISHKESDQKLIAYLLEIVPNYDQERVYVSDIKKVFQWYNLLFKSGELKLAENSEDSKVEANDENVVVNENSEVSNVQKTVEAKSKTKTASKSKETTAKKAVSSDK